MPLEPVSYGNINSLADFSPLAQLGDVYRKAQNQQKLSDLGKQLSTGSIDYRQAAAQVADMGDINSTLKFLALAEQQRKETLGQQASADFTRAVGGGQPTAAQTIAAPPAVSVSPVTGLRPNAAADDEEALPPPRVPVASTPNVVGTAEGIARGLYPPTQTAALAPVPPSFDDRFAAARPSGVPSSVAVAPPVAAPPPAVLPAVPTAAPVAKADFQLPSIPMLLGALTNQYLPDAQKKIAEDMLKRQYDALKPTDKIATLQAMRDDPKLFEMEKELRRQQKTDVNILPGEKAQDVEMGKTLGEIHSGYIKDALKVPERKNNLDAAERAMNTPGFYSGTASDAVRATQRALGALGIADADTAAPSELFQKLQNKAIMDSGGSASGLGPQISNNDARIIRDSTFNATNTPEGNRMIIGFQRLIEDRKTEAIREMNRYAKAHGGRIDINVTEHMADWADKNPLDFSKVPGFKKPGGQGGATGGTIDPALEAEMQRRKLR